MNPLFFFNFRNIAHHPETTLFNEAPAFSLYIFLILLFQNIYHRLVADIAFENTSLKNEVDLLKKQLNQANADKRELSRRYNQLIEENDLLRTRLKQAKLANQTPQDCCFGDNNAFTRDFCSQTKPPEDVAAPSISTQTTRMIDGSDKEEEEGSRRPFYCICC